MDVVVERVTIGATPTDTRAGLERLLDGATGSEGGAPQISLHVAVAQVEGLVEHDVLITFMRSYIDIPEHERVDVVWEATTGGPMPFPGLTGRLQLTPEAAGTLLTVAGSPLELPAGPGTMMSPQTIVLLATATAHTLAEFVRVAVESTVKTRVTS